MSIRIKAWEKWQGACIARVKRNRKWRNESPKHPNCDVNAPFSMQSVSISTSFDRDFVTFLDRCKRRTGETIWLRTIQYAGLHGAMFGVIDVDRRLFGPIVLSRPWDMVSKAQGAKFYDALIECGLCAEDADEYIAKASQEASDEAPPDAPPEALTSRARARSRPFPSRPVPEGGREGRRSRDDGDSGSSGGRAAAVAPPGDDEPKPRPKRLTVSPPAKVYILDAAKALQNEDHRGYDYAVQALLRLHYPREQIDDEVGEVRVNLIAAQNGSAS